MLVGGFAKVHVPRVPIQSPGGAAPRRPSASVYPGSGGRSRISGWMWKLYAICSFGSGNRGRVDPGSCARLGSRKSTSTPAVTSSRLEEHARSRRLLSKAARYLSRVPSKIAFQVRSPFCLIEIGDKALADMRRYRQTANSAPEAGGVLLGSRRGPHFEIVEATAPQRADLRTRFSFVRIGSVHRKLARRQWKKSGRQHGYLGEWHTHAEPSPTPSLVDRLGWQVLFKQMRQPLIHLIVGTIDVRLWYCDANGVFHEARLLPVVTSWIPPVIRSIVECRNRP